MRAHLGSNAQIGLARQRAGELLLRRIEACGRLIGRDVIVGREATHAERNDDGNRRNRPCVPSMATNGVPNSSTVHDPDGLRTSAK